MCIDSLATYKVFMNILNISCTKSISSTWSKNDIWESEEKTLWSINNVTQSIFHARVDFVERNRMKKRLEEPTKGCIIECFLSANETLDDNV